MSPKSVMLRKLGNDGPSVPALGFGLIGLAGAYGTPPSEEEQFKLLDRAVELGQTFWDTADIYGNNEETLGKWFKRTGKRNEIFLSTKFGIYMENGQFLGMKSSREYCRKACEESLKKLGTDYIDLFYVHGIDTQVPIEETMRELAALKAEGKIRHIGLSEASSNTIRRAYKIAPVAAVQVEYSLFTRGVEQEESTNILKTCRELGVTTVCYSPLGRGLITGAFSTRESISNGYDIRAIQFPRFTEDNLKMNAKIVEQLKTFADKKGCTMSQLALAWLLKQGDDIIPNPGTKSINHLEQNLAALDINLSDDEESELRKFIESVEIAGYRSVAEAKDHCYVDTIEES